jgi:hypothetical protein
VPKDSREGIGDRTQDAFGLLIKPELAMHPRNDEVEACEHFVRIIEAAIGPALDALEDSESLPELRVHGIDFGVLLFDCLDSETCVMRALRMAISFKAANVVLIP